ncbi:unnamed protein product [Rhizoctonia solani]|uniref:Uncharacterized protein n=1 Tax=Rhizoctonia solani TaxID=456999 RepID=A0A8H3GRR9_9AGAM|nr:unnamed protein product [Rhizoctonia solani]
MAAATSNEVQTKLNYASYRDIGPQSQVSHIQISTSPPRFRRNYTFEERNVTIRDLRGQQDQFNLDMNGFQISSHSTSPDLDLNSDSSIRNIYYPEIIELVSKITKVAPEKIRPLCYTIRDSSANPPPVVDGPEGVVTGPWRAVHVDRTVECVQNEEKTTERVRHLSVWRPILPIGQTVQHEPLAVADGTTSPPSSALLPLHMSVNGGTYTGLLYPSGLVDSGSYSDQWYYLSAQTSEEVTIIKNCDSQPPQNGAKLCLHSSFGVPTAGVTRRSINVNVLVVG